MQRTRLEATAERHERAGGFETRRAYGAALLNPLPCGCAACPRSRGNFDTTSPAASDIAASTAALGWQHPGPIWPGSSFPP